MGAAGGVGTSTVGLLLAVALAEGARPYGVTSAPEPGSSNNSQVVYVEADRAGGVAGARFDLGIAGGLQAWVAGLASDPTLTVDGFGKVIGDGQRVVPGPVSWIDAERLLTPAVIDMVALAMKRHDDRWWVVDIGRGGAALDPMVEAADVAVIVGSGLPEHVVRLPPLVSACRPATCIVVIGGRSAWPLEEIRQHCGADVVIDGPEYGLRADQIVDLVDGRKRRRSLVWRSILRCRDAVVDAGSQPASRPQPAPGRSVG